MKNVLLGSLFTSLIFFHGLASADDKVTGAPQSKGIFVVNIDQGPQGTAMMLTDLSSCMFQENKFLCGQYADDAWLNGKTVYINPTRVNSIYAFASVAEYKAAINKYQGRDHSALMDRILGK
ncbi:MAG: hypothetical protein K1X79_07805 [Oligoflexia bacterium]|nr:hypothetical protein [Oligoflexia bacterium]